MKNILVTGGSGLVGNHLKKILPSAHYISSKNYDLTKEKDVINMYNDINPTHVVHLAARVGGIMDNIKNPVEYFDQNILMNTFTLKYAYKYKVERFTAILSSCIYPDKLPIYPIKESVLHLGPPTETNFSYGIAKRCLAVQIDAYNKQYNTKYNYICPCNLYGEFDKSNEEKSHFVTALVKKISEAVKNNKQSITLYGDGTPYRQFMHATDLAKVIKITLDNDITDSFNLSPPENLTINQIASIALNAISCNHLKIIYDTTKPNGQFRKDIDSSLFNSIIPNYEFITLEEGIKRYYKYINNDLSTSNISKVG